MLRTWRLSDDAWIDAGPTAQVETLPAAVDGSPDYCYMRETMLLHDGVELPCVMETRYTIEDLEARPGISGTRHLVREEPTVVSRLVLGAPNDEALHVRYRGGAPAPIAEANDATKLHTWTFEMRDLAPEPLPASSGSGAGLPRVIWFTWDDHRNLAANLYPRSGEYQALEEGLLGFLSTLADARTPAEKAKRVADFVATGTRFVDVTPTSWVNPRCPERTWATGYGNRVDRAVLAHALFHFAGFGVTPGYLATDFGESDHDLPTLDWTAGPSLRIAGQGVEGWYDPATSTLSLGNHATLGRVVWLASGVETPRLETKGDRYSGKRLRFDFTFDPSGSTWKGGGSLVGSGILSPFHRMSGAGSEALGALGASCGSLLNGIEITTFAPEAFTPEKVALEFEAELEASHRDDRGRLVLEVAPFAEALPGDLHEEHRQSAVRLPSVLDYRLELRLDFGELDVVRLPEARVVENEAGRFEIAFERHVKTEGVYLVRTLTLKQTSYPAEMWPQLRALLLANTDRSGRTLLFK